MAVTTADNGLHDAMPWVEKYRPESLEDVAAHAEIINTIDRLVVADKLPHLLLYGPPGTGKTSTIIAMAKKMYGGGNKYKNMTLELNASDDRGIAVVRREIQDFASTKRIFSHAFTSSNGSGSGSVKLVILDECDAMTKDAQYALRRIIEKYTRNTRFCLICNYVSKIIPALQSRCTRFRFPPLAQHHCVARLSYIARKEQILIDDDAILAIIELAKGDMRKCVNLLQSTALVNMGQDDDEKENNGVIEDGIGKAENITSAVVYSCTGNPAPEEMKECQIWLMNDRFTEAYKKIRRLQIARGLSLVDIVRSLLQFLLTVSIPSSSRVTLLSHLADIEYRLSLQGATEQIQLASLVGVFTLEREKIIQQAI